MEYSRDFSPATPEQEAKVAEILGENFEINGDYKTIIVHRPPKEVRVTCISHACQIPWVLRDQVKIVKWRGVEHIRIEYLGGAEQGALGSLIYYYPVSDMPSGWEARLVGIYAINHLLFVDGDRIYRKASAAEVLMTPELMTMLGGYPDLLVCDNHGNDIGLFRELYPEYAQD